jgi:hypothetical protein
MWEQVKRTDPRGLALYMRHYSYKGRHYLDRPKSLLPPARSFVLLTPDARAVWGATFPYPQYVKHAYPGLAVNNLFRNEGTCLSSSLVKEATALTLAYWPEALGVVSFINARKIRSANPGYCYLCAGYHRQKEKTKSGLIVVTFTASEA